MFDITHHAGEQASELRTRIIHKSPAAEPAASKSCSELGRCSSDVPADIRSRRGPHPPTTRNTPPHRIPLAEECRELSIPRTHIATWMRELPGHPVSDHWVTRVMSGNQQVCRTTVWRVALSCYNMVVLFLLSTVPRAIQFTYNASLALKRGRPWLPAPSSKTNTGPF